MTAKGTRAASAALAFWLLPGQASAEGKSCQVVVTTPGAALQNRSSNSIGDLRSLRLGVTFRNPNVIGHRDDVDFLFDRGGTLFTLQCLYVSAAGNPICVVGRFRADGDTNLDDVIAFSGSVDRPMDFSVSWDFDGNIALSQDGAAPRSLKVAVGPVRLKISGACDVSYAAGPG